MLSTVLYYLRDRLKQYSHAEYYCFATLLTTENGAAIGQYTASGEFEPIDLDNNKTTFYFREHDSARSTISDSESMLSDQEMMDMHYFIRVVMYAPKLGDDKFSPDKMRSNVRKALIINGDKALERALGVFSVNVRLDNILEGDVLVNQEFAALSPEINSEYSLQGFNIEIIITAEESCFHTFDCDAEAEVINICDADASGFASRFNEQFATKTTDNLAEGETNLYYSVARVRAALDATDGLSYNTESGVFGIGVGYHLPTDAEVEAWNTGADIPSGTIAQYWRGDKTFQDLDTSVVPENGRQYFTSARARVAVSNSAPLTYNSTTGIFGITKATHSVDGYLSHTDWDAFTSKQDALGYTPVNIVGDTMLGYLTLNSAPTNANHAATKKYIDDIVTGLVNGSPATLDTLKELADALADDPNFATTIATSLAGKEPTIASGANTTYWRGDKTFVDFNTSARAAVSGASPLTYNQSTGAFGITQADSTHSGYISNTDWNSFNSKEPAISAGSAGQYWRYDKTWHTLDTLAVAENTNLYYTDARARAAISINGLPFTYSGGILGINAAASGQAGYVTTGSQTIDGIKTLTSKLIVGNGTITSNLPVLDLSQTWNNSIIPFTGIRFNATNLASSASSLLLDLQVGGVSQFKIDKNGAITSTGQVSFAGGNLTSGSGRISIAGGTRYGGNSPMLGIFSSNTGVPSLVVASNVTMTTPVTCYLRSENDVYQHGWFSTKTATSGTIYSYQNAFLFDPSSGTALFSAYGINPTINQKVGTTSGDIWIVDINPTITRAISAATTNRLLRVGTGGNEIWSVDFNGDFHFSSTNGTKLGIANTDKIGLWGATPVVQQTGGAATAGALYTSTEQTMLQTIWNVLRTIGAMS